jgi:hypothetical protein
MRTGTKAIIVDAIPDSVYLIEISEKETPRKGPKKAPIVVDNIAGLFKTEAAIVFHLPKTVTRKANPVIPARILICVAAKGS